jgi:hypothetical protein
MTRPDDDTWQLVRAAVYRFVDTRFATEVTLEVPKRPDAKS